jgi:hypothetical protein
MAVARRRRPTADGCRGPRPGSLRVPGLRVPGLRVPGLRVPGLRVPGLRVPGLRVPGPGRPPPSGNVTNEWPDAACGHWHSSRTTTLEA